MSGRRPYGARGNAIMTHAELALEFGVTRERVRAIESAALEKLRKQLMARGFTLVDLLPDEVGSTEEDFLESFE